MRLIDADKLIKEVNDNKELRESERVYLEGLLLNAPTVEPTYQMPKDYIKNKLDYERPTGKWLYHEEWKNEGGCGYECSCCGRTYDYAMNFCGYCGADMRGDNND